jgi:hypothetical protein
MVGSETSETVEGSLPGFVGTQIQFNPIYTTTMTGYILFHQFKHHRQYIKTWMGHNSGNLSTQNIQTIKTLGSSQLDMYCGNLGVDDILTEVSNYLVLQGIQTITQYRQWINDGFKLCTLSDSAVFTLRFIANEQPIHLHPARHVPHTMRVKANALKTVICYMLAHDDNNLSIEALNVLRLQYLQLPPLSATADIREMEKVFELLSQ